MNEITQPLRLAVGSHKAGSGMGCAMNIISWETGEATITDMPACVHQELAKVVQNVNDEYCIHRASSWELTSWELAEEGAPALLLCPPCSVKVLELAHRTVGTALDYTMEEERNLYLELEQFWDDYVYKWVARYGPVASGCEDMIVARLMMERAHAIIDRFEELTGVRGAPVPPEVTEAAYCQMVGSHG